MTQSGMKQFLECLKADFWGDKQYRRKGADQGLSATDEADLDKIIRGMNDDIDEALAAIGMMPGDIAGQERKRTLQIMRMEGIADPIDAYEQAVCENLQRKIDLGIIPEFEEKITGWDDMSDER